MMKWWVAAFVVLAASGCSGSDGGDDSVPATETVAVADESPCSLLDAATVGELAGAALDGTETTISGTDVAACRYGQLADVGVQVANVPAEEWARALPALVEAIRSLPADALGSANIERLENAAELVEQGHTVSAADACDYFSSLIELQNQPPGTTRIVTYFPSAAAPVLLSGQQCVDGRYSTISVGRPDLATANGLEERVVEILDELGPQ